MSLHGYVRIACKELVRKPARNSLAIVALLLCSLVLVILVAFSYAAHQLLLAQLGPSQDISLLTVTAAKTSSLLGIYGNVQLANQKDAILTDRLANTIAALPYVSFINPVSVIYEFKNFQVVGTHKTFVAQTEGLARPNSQSLPLSAGHLFNAESTAHDSVIGLAYAKQLGYANDLNGLIGKSITITTQNGYRGAGANIPGPITTQAQNDQYNNTATNLTATIVGVSAAGPAQNELFISEAWAHQVRTQSYWQYDSVKAAKAANPTTAAYSSVGELKSTDQINEDGYTSIVIGSNTPQEVPAISSAINKMGLGVISNAQLVTQLDTYTKVLGLIVGSIAIITFVASSLGIVNTFLMLVNEQRYVIAIWRACGATRSQILLQYLFQAALIGLIGGTLGVLLGFYLTVIAIDKVLHLLEGSSLIVAKLSLPPEWLIGGGIIFTVVFSVIAGLFPAISAAHENLSKTLSAGQ
jgi:ABC-type antimicrobial peptide transport system permease subunit